MIIGTSVIYATFEQTVNFGMLISENYKKFKDTSFSSELNAINLNLKKWYHVTSDVVLVDLLLWYHVTSDVIPVDLLLWYHVTSDVALVDFLLWYHVTSNVALVDVL